MRFDDTNPEKEKEDFEKVSFHNDISFWVSDCFDFCTVLFVNYGVGGDTSHNTKDIIHTGALGIAWG